MRLFLISCSWIIGAGYHNVAKALALEGMLAFGHDHAGHGQSEGIPAYIDSVDDYVDDLVDHCLVSINLFFNHSVSYFPNIF